MEVYPRLTFNMAMRRKPFFYTVYLVLPCGCISSLALTVFFLPPDSGEKISVSITVMLSLSIFQILLMEVAPSSSALGVPLIGKCH